LWSGFFYTPAAWTRTRSFAQQKWFGVAIEAKKCLHFFVNERKRRSRCPVVSNRLHIFISKRRRRAK